MNINKAIKKLCKLKILTPDFWYPQSVNCVWNTYVSDRSTGKTTSFLLIGLMLYKSDDIITHYIRSTSPMISAGKIANMFGSIVSLGYISTIFENRWNNVIYQRSTHKFYLCLCDEDGRIVDQDTVAFCVAMSIDNAETYKSSYQCDKGDFIIAGIDEKSLLQAVDTAVELCKDDLHGIPVPDYVDENVSTKVVKIVQSYVGIVNKMVWRKS